MKLTLDLTPEQMSLLADVLDEASDCGAPGLEYRTEKLSALVALIQNEIEVCIARAT